MTSLRQFLTKLMPHKFSTQQPQRNDLKATHAHLPHRELSAEERAHVRSYYHLGHGSNATTGILFIQGFSSTPNLFLSYVDNLKDEGYSISAPLLPGHGTCSDDFAKATAQQWQQCVEQAYQKLSQRCQHIVVVALSMGGALALILAAQKQNIKQLILINPAVYEPLVIKLLPYYAPLLRFIGKTTFKTIGADIKKPDVYEVVYTHLPVDAALQLRLCLLKAQQVLSQVKTPTLILNSTQDHVIGTKGANKLLRSLACHDKSLIWLHNSYHVATLDNDADIILKHIKEKLRDA